MNPYQSFQSFVTSIAGRVGDVVLSVADISGMATGSLYPSSTFASLPAASNSGTIYLVTDVGINGSLWKDTGSWRLMFPVTVLAATVSGNTITGTNSEITFTGASVTLPANVMVNNLLRSTTHYLVSGTANSKTFRVWLGGTSFGNQSTSAAGDTNGRMTTIIANHTTANSQAATSDLKTNTSAGGLAAATGTETITGTLVLKFTGQLGNSADSITLQSGIAELIPGN